MATLEMSGMNVRHFSGNCLPSLVVKNLDHGDEPKETITRFNTGATYRHRHQNDVRILGLSPEHKRQQWPAKCRLCCS
jgi:hypothetical protein